MSMIDLHASPHWTAAFQKWASRAMVAFISPRDSRYEQARKVFNRFHDLYPALIVHTQDHAHIATIIQMARDNGVPLAIRGGGHHIAGYGGCNRGIVIDFSPFRRVTTLAGMHSIEVDAGARLADVDQCLEPHALVLPTGTISDTGIAGLTLGGGIGWLVGRHGLTCDNLIGADIVLADGTAVRAEAPEHNELLWALRGGGGNFGVVTRFRFRVFPSPRVFTAGSGILRFDHAEAALNRLLDFMVTRCPPDLTIAPILTRAGDKPQLSIDFCYADPNEQILQDFLNLFGSAQWAVAKAIAFRAWQRSFDHFFHRPLRGYWKARYSASVSALDISTVICAFARAPSLHSSILVEHLHGAFGAGADISAFPFRQAHFGILISSRWEQSIEDERNIRWVKESFGGIDPMNQSLVYPNYAGADDDRAVATLKNASFERLLRIKRSYDPTNIFRRNHNISQ